MFYRCIKSSYIKIFVWGSFAVVMPCHNHEFQVEHHFYHLLACSTGKSEREVLWIFIFFKHIKVIVLHMWDWLVYSAYGCTLQELVLTSRCRSVLCRLPMPGPFDVSNRFMNQWPGCQGSKTATIRILVLRIWMFSAACFLGFVGSGVGPCILMPVFFIFFLRGRHLWLVHAKVRSSGWNAWSDACVSYDAFLVASLRDTARK